MCGIIGLHVKNPALEPRLGELLSAMLEVMTTRGPDSAGIAIYADHGDVGADGRAGGPAAQPGERLRYSLRVPETMDWARLGERLAEAAHHDVAVERLTAESAVAVCAAPAPHFLGVLRELAPSIAVVGYGRAMDVVKDVGAPGEICARYDIPKRSGYQGIGHTRMATESAVTTAHSHPFAPAEDLALVHNGTFSNYETVRHRLARKGIVCDTDNDSEVAARLVAFHMKAGVGLDDALRAVLTEMDGFFTLLVTTRSQFAVVRDSFACKPAVIAETDDYVAMASEFQALAGLPGIADAEVFEPMPEEIHLWSR